MEMVMKKLGVLLIFALFIVQLGALSLISAEVVVRDEAVSSMAILELNRPAIFNLAITNNGKSDYFEIYTLVGLDLEPKEKFYIPNGETKTIVVKAYPKGMPQYYSFEYKIKGDEMGIQKLGLVMNIVELKDVFDIKADEINPDSENIVIHLKNKGGHSFDAVDFSLSSIFFDESYSFSAGPFEEKNITIALDKEELKEIIAGKYLINSKIKIENISATPDSAIIQFNEKAGIETTSLKEGFFLVRYEVDKVNKGNVPTEVTIAVSKNILSIPFTTFNLNYNKREISKMTATYTFKKELNPTEDLRVISKTHWWILILALIALVVIIYWILTYQKLVIRKKVSFVKTKGGEFALKVTLILKARSFVENIKLIDRIPYMVKLFERYGAVQPDKIDEANRRLEWNISGLRRGEERIFTYIIYSKIGVVGKFELPEAEAIYEYEGKPKETSSNVAFYVNERQEKLKDKTPY